MTSGVQAAAVSQRIAENRQVGAGKQSPVPELMVVQGYPGTDLTSEAPQIVRLHAVADHWSNIPLHVDFVAVFVIAAVASAEAAAVELAVAAVFESVVAFVVAAALDVAPVTATAGVVETVADVAGFAAVGVLVAAVDGAAVVAEADAEEAAVAFGPSSSAADEVPAAAAAESDVGNLSGNYNSNLARFCSPGIPDSNLGFVWAAQKPAERAEALMCSQDWRSHVAGDSKLQA